MITPNIKLSAFGEAAAIPFAEADRVFFQRGEQKLRFRMLKFIIERKTWRSTRVSFVELDDVAQEDDKRYKETNYKLDRQDMFNLEISVRLLATLISSYFLFRSLRLCVIQICG